MKKNKKSLNINYLKNYSLLLLILAVPAYLITEYSGFLGLLWASWAMFVLAYVAEKVIEP